ncbi:MAG: UDP-N-acetylmuramoyl-L-alanine--D-glutamate ligase [Actinomycetota bacterium]|nr:UDP-N-acetylmuramoyl-L-alanine--D-glutamate ligase [Actinomycetota bacterium]
MPSGGRPPAGGFPPELRRALVVGLGQSGAAAARALAVAGVEVVAAECRRAAVEAPTLAAAGVSEVLLGVDDLAAAALVEDVDVVVPSPGVPEHSAVLRRALERGLPVWSEPEVGWRLAPRRLVAITGTNGKTSVTELVTAMLTAAGVGATACGNIGHPFTTAATASEPDAVLVAELSSFQLRFVHRLRPRIGVLLNLAPDHLDWHSDFAAYAAAKGRVWQAQRRQDWAVGNAEDSAAATLMRSAAPGRVAWTTTASSVPEVGVGVAGQELVARLPCHEGPLLRLEELPSVAPHHVDNVAAASAAALLAGAEAAAVAGAARRFRPGRHRLEVVALGGGVAWVDDSKATNPHAAAAALRAFHSDATPSVVWIAGGQAKGVDLAPLAAELAAVRHAIFIGEAADELAEVAATQNLPVRHAASIEEAVAVAARVAAAGDTVLLAPGCASFDQFHDYAERGDRFAAAARSAAAREEGQGRPRRARKLEVGDRTARAAGGTIRKTDEGPGVRP